MVVLSKNVCGQRYLKVGKYANCKTNKTVKSMAVQNPLSARPAENLSLVTER